MKSDSETGLTGKDGQDGDDCGTGKKRALGRSWRHKAGFERALMNFQAVCIKKRGPAGPILDKLWHRL